MDRRIASALLVVAAFVPAVRAAEHLTNGGFEDEPKFGAGVLHDLGGYTAFTGTDIPGWTVVADHAVTVHNQTYAFISGTYSVNLDGEGLGGHNADFYQDFSTNAGGHYAINFDHLGWSIGEIAGLATVKITDLTTSATLYSKLFGWTSGVTHESGTFAGTGHVYRIEIFESPESGRNDNSLIVDNFSVTDIGTTVPAPAAALAGLPLLGTLVVARLRRSKRA